MLKGLNPLLSPELLHVLAEMGHGDDIVVVDGHFPAVTMAQRLVRLDGIGAPQALEAILSLLPIDTFVPDPVLRMQVVEDPDEVPDAVRDFQKVVDAAEGKPTPIGKIERFAFYERARDAFAVVATGEMRKYGCILVKKGLAFPTAP